MREHTYPVSYESHLRRRVKELERQVEVLESDCTRMATEKAHFRLRVKELERENERLNHRVNRMLTAGMGKDWGDGFQDTGAHEVTDTTP